jgi:hypothetical protein
MSYVISGLRQHRGRVASRSTAQAALAEICRMERDGYADVLVTQPFQPPKPAALFAGAQDLAQACVCATCHAACEGRAN